MLLLFLVISSAAAFLLTPNASRALVSHRIAAIRPRMHHARLYCSKPEVPKPKSNVPKIKITIDGVESELDWDKLLAPPSAPATEVPDLVDTKAITTQSRYKRLLWNLLFILVMVIII